MIKTKEEILEKHYKNYQRRIPFDEQILDAMEEYANQFRQPVTELNERNSVDEGEKSCESNEWYESKTGKRCLYCDRLWKYHNA